MNKDRVTTHYVAAWSCLLLAQHSEKLWIVLLLMGASALSLFTHHLITWKE